MSKRRGYGSDFKYGFCNQKFKFSVQLGTSKLESDCFIAKVDRAMSFRAVRDVCSQLGRKSRKFTWRSIKSTPKKGSLKGHVTRGFIASKILWTINACATAGEIRERFYKLIFFAITFFGRIAIAKVAIKPIVWFYDSHITCILRSHRLRLSTPSSPCVTFHTAK